MTRTEIIKQIEEIKRLLLEEVSVDELTDYAREETVYCIESAIDFLRENLEYRKGLIC